MLSGLNSRLIKGSMIDYRLSHSDTNLLKGIAICGMLCWHLFFATTLEECGIAFSSLTKFISITGDVCVSIFLFVSGYGLTISANKIENTTEGRRFMVKMIIRRLLKFYFNFWPIFIISVLIGTFVFDRPMPDRNSIVAWLYQIFGFSNQASYNNTWWFNSLILVFYLIFPLLYESIKKYPVYTLSISIITTSFSLKIGAGIAMYMPIFLVGMVYAYYNERIGHNLDRLKPIYIILIMTLLLILTLMRLYKLGEDGIFARGIRCYGILTILYTMYVVFILRKQNLLAKILSYLGKHSANIYLIHTFLYYYWFRSFYYSFENPFLIFCVLLSTSLLLSILIELLKSTIGVYRLQQYLINKIELLCNVGL